jgi:hypothetical protein
MSEEAAKAIATAVSVNDRVCAVRITEVRQRTKGRKLTADATLNFRLVHLFRTRSHKDDLRFVAYPVLVCIHKKYVRFLLGGRVLHYEERVDGSGFALWPLKKYRAYLGFVKGDETIPLNGADS